MASRIPDLVVDSKLEVECFEDYSIQTRFVSDPATGRRRTLQQERWQRTKELGRGTFGVVWLEKCATGPSLGKVRAVKEIVKQTASALATAYSRELEAIAKFSQEKYRHSFVRSFGWYENKNTIFITMEYLALGDLESGHLKKPLLSSEARQITQQLLEGLCFMHDNNFAHRDLKPANVLVLQTRPEWWIKIADFGIAKRIEGTELRTVIGTEAYLAPEVIGIYSPDSEDDEGAFSLAVDIWAVGAITFRMITGQIPFPPGRRLVDYVVHGKSFLTGCTLSPECTDFVLKTMAASPGRRPTSQEALSYPWVKMQEPIPSNPASSTQTFGRTETTSTLASVHWVEAPAQWTDLSAQQIEPSAKLTNDFDTLRIQNNDTSSTTSTSIEKPPTFKLFQELKPSPAIEFCYSIAFSPNKRWLACGTLDGIIQIWANDHGRFESVLKVKQDCIPLKVAFSPDGRRLASLTYSGKITIWDFEQVRLVQIQELKLFPDSYVPDINVEWGYAAKMAFSPDGRWLAVALIELSVIRIWGYNDQDRLELVQELKCHSGAWSIAFSANGKWLASGGHSNVVQIWAYKQGKFDLAQKLEARQGLLQVPGHQVTQIAFSPLTGRDLSLGFAMRGYSRSGEIDGEE